MRKQAYFILLSLVMIVALVTGCVSEKQPIGMSQEKTITIDQIPTYSGDPYIAINENVPTFKQEDQIRSSFETYSQLDQYGRCGVAYANVGQDIMPTEARESISHVKPSGWQSLKFEHVDGKYLYNRCHLIGFQLTAENDNEENLITGTRYLNVEGMLPFENMIADYVKETGHHVLYRVTPIFKGNELVARGVQMEAYSVEDEGEGISFNVYAYNVQPGVTIDYATGKAQQVGEENQVTDEKENTSHEQMEIRGNSNSKIYHCPGQASYEDMADSKHLVRFGSEEEAIKAGYRKAKR